jgi:hypothetical protein
VELTLALVALSELEVVGASDTEEIEALADDEERDRSEVLADTESLVEGLVERPLGGLIEGPVEGLVEGLVEGADMERLAEGVVEGLAGL